MYTGASSPVPKAVNAHGCTWNARLKKTAGEASFTTCSFLVEMTYVNRKGIAFVTTTRTAWLNVPTRLEL